MAWSSVAALVITPLQDLLNLWNGVRMNQPVLRLGTVTGVGHARLILERLGRLLTPP